MWGIECKAGGLGIWTLEGSHLSWKRDREYGELAWSLELADARLACIAAERDG